jgi:hypothetical protein
MKFFSIAAIVSLIATAMSAQGIEIGAPANGAQIKAGRKFKVEVVEPVRLSYPVILSLAYKKCRPRIPLKGRLK